MEQNKKWTDANSADFIINHLKSQIEELPNSHPQKHIRSSNNNDKITIVFFSKPDDDLSKLYSLTNNLSKIFGDKSHIKIDKNSDPEVKRGDIIELTIEGNISELTDTLKTDIISKYLNNKIESIDVKPTPSTEITVEKQPDGKHKFHVVILDNKRDYKSPETQKLHSDAISMMQNIFNDKKEMAKKVAKKNIPSLNDVNITGTLDEIINAISKKDKKFSKLLSNEGSHRQQT